MARGGCGAGELRRTECFGASGIFELGFDFFAAPQMVASYIRRAFGCLTFRDDGFRSVGEALDDQVARRRDGHGQTSGDPLVEKPYAFPLP